MKNLLQINASIFGEHGQSTRLAEQFVVNWIAANPGSKVTVRDIAKDPMPHLTAQRFGAFLAKPEERTPEQHAVVDFSDRLIDEIRNADVLVLGLPMYNLGIPSMLKAYFDHVARAGVSFRYTEKGPVGLLTGKKAYVFATRGGAYAGTPLDTQTSYVRHFLGFIGIADVEFVNAEKLSMGEDSKQEALQQALDAIAEITGVLQEA